MQKVANPAMIGVFSIYVFPVLLVVDTTVPQ